MLRHKQKGEYSMKLKKLLFPLVITLCLSMILASCGNTGNGNKKDEDTSDLMNAIFSPDFTIPTQKIVSVKTPDVSGVVSNYSNTFAVLEKEDSISVYSALTDSVVATYPNGVFANENASPTYKKAAVYIPSQETAFVQNVFVVLSYTTNIDPSTSNRRSDLFNTALPAILSDFEIKLDFFDAHGTIFHTVSNNSIKHSCGSALNYSDFDRYFDSLLVANYNRTDLLSVEQSVYKKLPDGKVALLRNFDTLAIPEFTQMSAENYYAVYDAKNIIKSYDESLNEADTFVVPFELPIDSAEIFVFNNGNVLLQSKKLLLSDVTEYDFMEEGIGDTYVKYDLVSYLINIEDEKASYIDLNYIVNSVDTVTFIEIMKGAEYQGFFDEDIENIASVTYIGSDKILYNNSSSTENVTLTNEAAIDMYFAIGENWKGIPYVFSNGYFSVTDLSGDTLIVDRDGNTIMKFNDRVLNYYSGVLASINNKIYNLTTGEMIYDIAANNASILHSRGFFIVVEPAGDLESNVKVILANGSIVDIGKKSTDHVFNNDFGFGHSGYYYIKTAESEYKYYNAEGELIHTSSTILTEAATFINGGLLFDSEGKYYKFAYNHSISI